ncbi:MAG: TetR family transcriptional regulator [Acidimicrobiales bacterium]
MTSEPGGRGRDTVIAALVDATAAMLAEEGPARITLRGIADRAGVNKGQIHHYFGSKQALIEAAVRQLATAHHRNATERAGGPMPLPLTLGLDVQYWQAIVRLVLDGDLDTAGLEFDEGISVPQRALLEAARRAGGQNTTGGDAAGDGSAPTEIPTDLKAAVAGAMATELGWDAFKDFILRAVKTDDSEEADLIEENIRESLRANPVFDRAADNTESG